MTTESRISITVEATVNVPVERAWLLWTIPEHIMQWNNASEDWHTPKAESDLREGATFCYTMAAKDGSFSFDFAGTFDRIAVHKLITYTLGDGRKVQVHFKPEGNSTIITEVFEAENIHSPELQQQGWQAILNNFKRYAETNS